MADKDETHVVVDLDDDVALPAHTHVDDDQQQGQQHQQQRRQGQQGRQDNGFGLDVNGLTAAVGTQVLKSGSESASRLVSTYGRIDLLRPYFDLDPKDLRQRLLASIWPRFARQPQAIATDLYGPMMLALTLSAVLLLSMKQSGHILRYTYATIYGNIAGL
ncbi:hypothetical protein PTSG_04683 [Salpingoeca rosetta]|uniref:Uncharacterized protein n=1 Tax=Salpingoeca rosetta (strain ATCC 50818 / BSB-021) TaxID=946362 RepID=F2U847_SALR5|nr:uncharacterized protein PTSG_04683 [Salpingoeca rosetta]EGD72952.1 hypothetical protein PTSG_04683 [Salpingoeca rosetta]|eukprot:XP_004994774.1 hypothetical protein PTSG_04683 [Salpingoeca rosetta]